MKRGNHEGTFRKRKDNRWEARVMDGYRANGKPLIRSFYGKTKRQAREKLKQFLSDKASGLDLDRDYLFGEWAGIWYEEYCNDVTETTRENYKYILKVLVEAFGNIPLRNIRPLDIQRFLRELQQQGRSYSYISKCKGLLHAIFRKAQANYLVGGNNPVEYVDKLRCIDSKQREAFSTDEVERLMKFLKQDKMGISIRLLLGTGLRMGELLGLESSAIKDDGSEILVRQAVHLVKGKVKIGPPKTSAGYRDVPIPNNLRKYAIQLKNCGEKYVWQSPNAEQPINPSTFRKKFKQAIGEVENVRVLTPHSTRHFYISMLTSLNVNQATIQALVGHSSYLATKRYIHVQRPDCLEAAELVAQAFPRV